MAWPCQPARLPQGSLPDPVSPLAASAFQTDDEKTPCGWRGPSMEPLTTLYQSARMPLDIHVDGQWRAMMLTLRLEVGSIKLVVLKDGKEAPVFHLGRSSKAGSLTSGEDVLARVASVDGKAGSEARA